MGIIYEKKGPIAYITIDNPDKGNILDHQTSDEISEAWKNTWALVIRVLSVSAWKVVSLLSR